MFGKMYRLVLLFCAFFTNNISLCRIKNDIRALYFCFTLEYIMHMD